MLDDGLNMLELHLGQRLVTTDTGVTIHWHVKLDIFALTLFSALLRGLGRITLCSCEVLTIGVGVEAVMSCSMVLKTPATVFFIRI